MTSSSHRRQIESLECVVVDGGPSPKIAVIICHGYGADCHDLAPLAGEWMQVLGENASSFRFVFPDAPDTLAELGMPDGRSWWPIDTMQMAMLIQQNQFDQLHELEPPELAVVRSRLCEVVNVVMAEIDGSATPLVLGGFSQGAMLALDAALRGPIQTPQVLVQFSGTLFCKSQWQAAIHRLKDTYVFQSHGTMDPILPYSSAVTLHELFEAGQIRNEFHSFAGPHTIDADSVIKTAAAMAELA